MPKHSNRVMLPRALNRGKGVAHCAPKMRRKWAKMGKNSKFLVLALKKEKKTLLLCFITS